MKIIGFNLNKVSIEKTSIAKGKLEIKSGLDIQDITKEEINISNTNTIKFDFKYTVDYNPNIAKIDLRGFVIILDDKNEGKEILQDWKKKKFNHPVKLPLFNFIMGKCNIKALQLEDELGLPLHIPLPKLQATPKGSENKANYAG